MASTIYRFTSLVVIFTIVVTGFACPSSDWELQADGSCLRQFREVAIWADACQSCVQYGGRLVQIGDADKNKAVSDLVSKQWRDRYSRHPWIGLRNTQSPHGEDFKYVDGSRLGDYQPFAKGTHRVYNSDIRARCVFQNHNQTWRVDLCTNMRPYVCSTTTQSGSKSRQEVSIFSTAMCFT